MSKPAQQLITILVNGRPVQALSGQSVHAVLTAVGIRTLGTGPRQDRARGVFCGMGVCYECLVTVNGRPYQRACMLEVEEGMEIKIHAM
ncbi:MAG: (2Fe-2S)-binding protein [Desulfovermiculus sp.]|nr:(2Fe-2S)-binding protein [Desulfovermiculus sp.]